MKSILFAFMPVRTHNIRGNSHKLYWGDSDFVSLFKHMKIMSKKELTATNLFEDGHFIDNVLPDFGFNVELHQRPDVPYVVLLRYDLRNLNDSERMKFNEKLNQYSKNIMNNFQEIKNGVYLSNDRKYYIKNYKEEMDFYNILIQFKEEDEDEDYILIYNAEAVIHVGFLNEGNEEAKQHSDSLYQEEAIDELDQMEEEGE